MMAYSCECGKTTGYGSMPPFPCQACPDCGTAMNYLAVPKVAAIPHDWASESVDTTEGPKWLLPRCRRCGERQPPSESREWFERRFRLEGDQEIGAGPAARDPDGPTTSENEAQR